MKLFLLSSIVLSLFAAEEFPYIKPISVEYPTKIQSPALESKSLKENIQDQDKDGVEDAKDKCPNTPEGIKVNKKGCELDSDGDGIFDSKDSCPNTKIGFIVDEKGCPSFKMPQLSFQTNEYKMTSEQINSLQEFADFLKKNPSYQVVIYAYAFDTTSKSENKSLSQKRAQAVQNALLSLGISSVKLTAIGMGEARLEKDDKKENSIDIELLR